MKAPAFMNSIRWRLIVWTGFLLACVLGAFAFTAYRLHLANQLDQVDEELARRLSVLRIAVRMPPGMRGPGPGPIPGPGPRPGERFQPPRRDFEGRGPFGFGEPLERREIQLPGEAARLFNDSETNSFYFVIWSRAGVELKRSTNAPPEVERPVRLGRERMAGTRTREGFRESYLFTERGDCLLAGVPMAARWADTRRLMTRVSLAAAAVLLLGLGGAWVLATRALAPIDEISTAANRIAAGNLSERIATSDTASELGRLASVLNSSFSRLEAAFVQQKQFTADASHELRTPLAVIISEAQTALMRDRPAAEYRQSLEECLEAAQQMRKLADALLDLARFDAGQAQIENAPVDLAEVARQAAGPARSLDAARELAFEFNLDPAPVTGDATRLGQVATNLINNAIQYNKPGGTVCIETGTQNSTAFLKVSDTGQGIAPEDLGRIFERFFRADQARTGSQGRTGLGLAIARSIVELHRGKIEVCSRPGEGTAFTVLLPVGSTPATK